MFILPLKFLCPKVCEHMYPFFWSSENMGLGCQDGRFITLTIITKHIAQTLSLFSFADLFALPPRTSFRNPFRLPLCPDLQYPPLPCRLKKIDTKLHETYIVCTHLIVNIHTEDFHTISSFCISFLTYSLSSFS